MMAAIGLLILRVFKGYSHICRSDQKKKNMLTYSDIILRVKNFGRPYPILSPRILSRGSYGYHLDEKWAGANRSSH